MTGEAAPGGPGELAGLAAAVAATADASGFSGAVRVDAGGATVVSLAAGLADRAHGIPNRIDTRFGIASGTKGWTALTVMRLVERGALSLTTSVRSVLGADLPLIAADVTVEQLLAHRAGIGDYLDEEVLGDISEPAMPVPVHRLATTEDYLAVLDGHPTKFPAGTGFAYCNSGFVVLALVVERVTGTPFHELVEREVCVPAGLTDTRFERSDELPGDVAVGYLHAEGPRTNVLHLPVRGSGDGGLCTTLADVHRLWAAVTAGRVVSTATFAAMVAPRSTTASGCARYGLGFWLDPVTAGVQLEGYDAGVSFRSVHDPERAITWTVVANTSEGAWPVARAIADHLRG